MDRPYDHVLTRQERDGLALRALFEARGYGRYRMEKFEEYALYADHLRFLGSERAITFTDLDGRLLALKPDVTLSIVNHYRPRPGHAERLYYSESVYRPDEDSGSFREIDQTGLECLGDLDESDRHEVAALAAQSLSELGEDGVLVISHMGFLTNLMRDVPDTARRKLLTAVRRQSAPGIRAAAIEQGFDERDAERLAKAGCLRGEPSEVLPKARALSRGADMTRALDELEALCEALSHRATCVRVRVDFSLVNAEDYYNGIVFQGFLSGVPRCVLSGGQYDKLLERLKLRGGAIGFAVYHDVRGSLSQQDAGRVLTVALPKGRLADQTMALMRRAGYPARPPERDDRRLTVEFPDCGLRCLLVKPSDVPIYVERGAADIGVAGSDVLSEGQYDVCELLDTFLGQCRLCVAAPDGWSEDDQRALRVATKYPRIAKAHYTALGREIDLVKLHGSIELAPLTGLSDVIVDIVESGATLRENHLAVKETLCAVSARLIANRASAQLYPDAMTAFCDRLSGALER